MKRKVVSILLTVALTVALAACGGSGGSSDADTQEGTGEGIAGGKDVTITFWEHNANVEEQSPFLYQCAQAFMEENPNVTIDLVGSDNQEHLNKIVMAAQSNSLPDMFFLNWANYSDFVEQGLVYDMSDDIADIQDNFVTGMLRPEEDGSVYGVPNETMLGCYFYNTELFDQCGVEYPTDDWTWEDFMDACQTFKDAGITPISVGGMTTNAVWMHQETLCRYGFFNHLDGILDGTDTWVNDDFIKAYEKMAEIGSKGYISANATTTDYYQACETFYAGEAAFLDAGAWECGKITSKGLADQMNIWLGPVFDDASDSNVAVKTATAAYSISAASAEDPDKLEAMIAFINFMYGPEGTQICIDDAASVPVTVYDDTSYDNASPMIQKVLEAFENDFDPCYLPNTTIPASTTEAFYDSIWGAVYGTYTPEEALENLQAKFDEAMAE